MYINKILTKVLDINSKLIQPFFEHAKRGIESRSFYCHDCNKKRLLRLCIHHTQTNEEKCSPIDDKG